MATHTPIEKMLTPEQAATRLGVSVDTVRQYAREPLCRLRAVRFLGRLLFEPREIERYARQAAEKGRPKLAAKLGGTTT
jgi:excisionase family DNA binding protein